MPIENASRLISNIREKGDFSGESGRWDEETLLVRSDRARVVIRRHTQKAWVINQIALISPDDKTIIQLNYYSTSEDHVSRLGAVEIGVPAIGDRDYLFATVINLPGSDTDPWVDLTTFGQRWDFVSRPEHERDKIHEMQRSGWYHSRSDLPSQLDESKTAEIFLNRIQKWLNNESLFKSASLKPELAGLSSAMALVLNVVYQHAELN
jgi:hypothetical protein